MKTYHILSNIKFLKKYSFKFLFVAFLGIHIPLIGLIIYLIVVGGNSLSPMAVLISVLIFTLLATGMTLFILNKLLEPILLTKSSLSNYLEDSIVPELPENYTDEVGILMKEVQYTINSVNNLIEEKKDLIGLMSHDLKNPLSAVVNYAELIPMADSEEKKNKLTNSIKEAANAQKQIINAVLEMLESETKMIANLTLTDVSIDQTLEKISDLYSEVIKNKELIIEKDIKHDNLKFNPDLFEQVFTNLFSNAIKFSNPKGRIIISSFMDKDFVQIELADEGIGFQPDNAEYLFDRFTTFKKKGTLGEDTTGLGLYLSKKIVENNKGTIKAVSEGQNKGAKFITRIPLRP